MTPIERQTIRKISWRILPLIIAIYFIAYIDRTNVAFAAIAMNRDLGFTPYIYGWGAGMFFLGYFFFEVPSNVILHRVGARVWIARIMVTWGIVSGLMMFVTGPVSFFVIRFLLGVAEAGFFPGTLLYFTYWFPAAYRARVISALFLAVPGSNAVAAALSGALLQLDGLWGLTGWQWMFLLEALPAILLAPVVLWFLTDRPSAAKWLTADERSWLETELNAEQRAVERSGHMTLWKGLTDRRVLGLSLVYLTIVTATYGITFFLPLIVKSLWPEQRHDRTRYGGAVHRRCPRDDSVGAVVGPASGTPVALHRGVGARRRRTGRRRRREPAAGRAGGDVARNNWPVWIQTGVLARAVDVSRWHRCRGWHCAGELDRQSRRLCRAVCRGLDSAE